MSKQPTKQEMEEWFKVHGSLGRIACTECKERCGLLLPMSRGLCVCLSVCVCLLDMTVSLTKTASLIEMPFLGCGLRSAQRTMFYVGPRIPRGRGILGAPVMQPFVKILCPLVKPSIATHANFVTASLSTFNTLISV